MLRVSTLQIDETMAEDVVWKSLACVTTTVIRLVEQQHRRRRQQLLRCTNVPLEVRESIPQQCNGTSNRRCGHACARDGCCPWAAKLTSRLNLVRQCLAFSCQIHQISLARVNCKKQWRWSQSRRRQRCTRLRQAQAGRVQTAVRKKEEPGSAGGGERER